ncbi:MAG TPA: glycosyltransferase [Sphingomicrobium sp.]|nr:glycosyltransferase [Sphingomicrobium sp.]
MSEAADSVAMAVGPSKPSLLVIDASYTLGTIRELGLETSVLSRDLNGYFRHVWTVHPFGELSAAFSDEGSGEAEWAALAPRHTFIQARPGRFRWLRRVFPLNFLLGQLHLFRVLRRLVRRETISIIRAGDPLYVGLFGLALAWSCRLPFMIRINADNDKARELTGQPLYPRLLRSIGVEKRLERFLLPRAHLVVAPNQDNVAFALASGAQPDRVAIFPYGNLLAPEHLAEPTERGCDRALFDRLGIEPGAYLLCVSRLQSVKFPDDAVRVLANLRSRGMDVKLLLAGEGPMREELLELAETTVVSNALVLAGNQDQRALAQLYVHAAVVISPLTGRALSEAALAAAPIVAYDLDWQGEMIETGVTGQLVPFRNQAALADAAAEFMTGRKFARAMGNAVRQRALSIFEPVGLNDHERREHDKLLGRSGREAE